MLGPCVPPLVAGCLHPTRTSRIERRWNVQGNTQAAAHVNPPEARRGRAVCTVVSFGIRMTGLAECVRIPQRIGKGAA